MTAAADKQVPAVRKQLRHNYRRDAGIRAAHYRLALAVSPPYAPVNVLTRPKPEAAIPCPCSWQLMLASTDSAATVTLKQAAEGTLGAC